MEEKKEKNFEEIISEAKTYLDTRVEYTRLFFIKRASKLFADIVTTAVVVVCFVLAFLLGTITLALYLASVLNSATAGFGVVALIYLLIAVVVFLAKDKFIEKAIVNFTIRKYFNKLEEEEEEDEQKV
ncbi:phage holin family protein [Pedobacter sp. MR2016-24]|uniref:phage holin family protein n=1 Tax=Pedobacter sp. MR2016-24 TaxID=2994466 RepID=UPI002245A831|nr:phage holin family protein [Pedobacter sp. MR2016-24]MCX2481919.1 phage holin family protein [Pedobacter sp. MR2016-24]